MGRRFGIASSRETVEKSAEQTMQWSSDWRDREVKTSLCECADQFLNILHQHRQHANERHRPLVLIGHSLGSIVIQQALVNAVHERDFTDLRLSVAGIIFLGAPFQGSDVAGFGTWLARLSGLDPTLLQVLRKGSQEIYQLSRYFYGSYIDYDIICFYEGKDTTFGGLLHTPVVSSQSASLLLKRRMALDTDHSGLNKFSGEDDENFALVLPEIQRIVRDGPSIVAERHRAWDTGARRQGKVPGTYEGSLLKQADDWIRNRYYTQARLKIERLSGDRLSMDQCYINLAITEQSGRDEDRSEGELDIEDTLPHSSPFSLSARLKVETPAENIQVELPTLFNPRKRPDGKTTQPRRILIRGQAGVGKTTLCKKMVHDFIRGTWSDLFDRILWIPLRNLKRQPDKGYTLVALFLRDFFSNTPHREDLAKTLEEALDTTKFGRTLLLLDGLDEVSDGLNINSDMNQFLEFLLGQPNVVITSRPSARLPHHLHPDLELETVGFYQDQVECYLEKTFGDSQKVHKIQSFLQDHLLMQSLVRIPIQLDALCYIWDEDSQSGLETMTDIYRAIEHSLFKKDIVRLGKIHNEIDIKSASRSRVEEFVRDEVSLLEGLAFTGLDNDIIDFNSEHRNAVADHFTPSLLLDKTLPCLSFLRTSDSSLQNRSPTYHFLHLTYQEYFAARYFVRQWMSGQNLKWLEFKTQETRLGGLVNYPLKEYTLVEYLQKYKYHARFDIFWRFVAGLLQAKVGDTQLCRLFRTIEEEPRDLLGPVHQRLIMRCLSEVTPSQETPEFNRLRKGLEGQLKQWLLFECEFNRSMELGIETECPDHLFPSLVRRESVALIVLMALKRRSRISMDIVDQVAAWLKDDSSADIKIAAFKVLVNHHKSVPENMFSNLILLLQDSNSKMRSKAAFALSEQSTLPEAILTALISLCQDSESEVRWNAAIALGKQSTLPEAILTGLISLCQDSDCLVRSSAADALGQQSILPEAALIALVLLCQDSESSQSTLPESALMALVSLFQDSESSVRLRVAGALGRQSTLPEAALMVLIPLCQDSESSVRSRAAEALGRQSTLPEAALMVLTSLCQDSDCLVRSSAADALGRQSILPESALIALVSLCQDSESGVRCTYFEPGLEEVFMTNSAAIYGEEIFILLRVKG
ncbi:hypothetical protein OIDMADRAFT_33184 [Oidiodendron maius Zn]|uniref:NACHT domain-containing protein n=1 Tax=Oidiodendron maius (strain Zn) TaxID=913774 RepID=A0A0C3CC93_OIDMZ|nr:hypothetical protein OIDMADRAFT_33184 [Oidiodendron maius Zn]